MLNIGVRDEGDNRVEDRTWSKHAEAPRVERHPRLQRQDQIAKQVEHGVKNQQRHGVLLPILMTGVEALLEPCKDGPGFILPIHDVSHVAAQWEGEDYGKSYYYNGQKPHSIRPLRDLRVDG